MKYTTIRAALLLMLGMAGADGALAGNGAALESAAGGDLLVDVTAGLPGAKGFTQEVWRRDGTARFVSAEQLAGSENTATPDNSKGQRSDDRTVTSGDQYWTAVNAQTGAKYRIEMPRELAHELHRLALQSGLAAGDAKGATPADKGAAAGSGPVLNGWSDGDDTRTRRFDNTVFPNRAIGQMAGSPNSGCSGTLVGRRHVLTAAHCLFDRKTDAWIPIAGTQFRPGREGTCNDDSCQPYGVHNPVWYFTPESFRNSDSWTDDYAVMVLDTAPGDETGWLGYVAIGEDSLRDYCDANAFSLGQCFNRGYPACSFSNAPVRYETCKQGWAYQDVKPCNIGSFGSKGSDGWNARFTTNCDLSGGHSGSAIYTNRWAGAHNVVVGVVSTEECRTCGPDRDYPNGIRRLTPDVLDAISYFKSAMP